MVRGRLPCAVEVVPLDRCEAQRVEQRGHVDARVDLRRARGEEGREQELAIRLLPVGAELLAELLEELDVVLLVLGPDDVARVPFRARPLPVDVDSVEDAGRGSGAAHAAPARIRDVSLDEEVDAGRDQALTRLPGERRVREVLRPRPAAERDQDLEVRVLGLQGLELLEVAEDRARPGHFFAGHGLVRGPRLLVVGPLVAELADDVPRGVRGHVSERVVDHGESVGRPTGLDVFHLVVPPVDAPLDEVADDVAASHVGGRRGLRARRCGEWCGDRDCRDGREDGKANGSRLHALSTSGGESSEW